MSHATPGASLAPTSRHTIGLFFPRTFFQPGDNDLTIVAHGASPMPRGRRPFSTSDGSAEAWGRRR